MSFNLKIKENKAFSTSLYEINRILKERAEQEGVELALLNKDTLLTVP